MHIDLCWLFLLPVAISCVAWTVTKEEIFREWRDYCKARKDSDVCLLLRKFYYVFTCEYCFSHWVTAFFLLITGYRLLLPGIPGFILALFVCVLIANVYMTAYSMLRAARRCLAGWADIYDPPQPKIAVSTAEAPKIAQIAA